MEKLNKRYKDMKVVTNKYMIKIHPVTPQNATKKFIAYTRKFISEELPGVGRDRSIFGIAI